MDTPELTVDIANDAEYFREQARETRTELRTAASPNIGALLVSIATAYEQLAELSERTRGRRGEWERL